MCGHVGMIGNISVPYEKLFADMLVVDSVRGIDSVGVAAVHADRSVSVHKRAMFPHDYMMSPGFREILKKANRVLIGHNRWATIGKVNNINAHPFEHGNIIGAHNGTLRQQWLLPDSQNFDIDSENIIHSINKQGIDATWRYLAGAAALVYWDKAQLTLNFIRNDERPFFYTYSKDRKAMFWASEDWMLSGLLKKHKIEHTKIVETQVDHHYSLPMEGYKFNDVLDKMHIRKLTPYAPPNRNTQNQSNLPAKKSLGPANRGTTNNNRERARIMSMFPIGTSIKFRYNRGKVNFKQPYLQCWMENHSEVNIRLFINNTHQALAGKLANGSQYDFVGRINGYDRGGNILVQANSVTAQERKIPEKKPVPLYLDFGGVMYNKADFIGMKHAAKDCAWCSSPIQFEEGNIVIDKHTTLCPSCAQEKSLQNWINNSRMGRA